MNELTKINRNPANGLINELNYTFTDEGLIDWRALIPQKYLYLNNGIKAKTKLEKKYNKNFNEIDIVADKVADTDLIINLQGLRYLSRIRGLSDVREVVSVACETYASVTSVITYLPNVESEMIAVVNSASASATLNNTTDFYQKYLVEAASNRAFARNIRGLLGISIVSREELGKDGEEDEGQKASGKSDEFIKQKRQILKDLLPVKKFTFEHLITKMKKEGTYKEEYKKIEDLPPNLVFDFLDRLKKVKTDE